MLDVQADQMASALSEFNDAVQSVQDAYDADLYFYSAGINDEGFAKLTAAVQRHRCRENALLVIVTTGGLANSAYQIARLLQNEYSNGKFSLFCPSYCKSAGTLVALGANELIMDTFSELGPLDVQLVKQNEIALRKSGLLARSSFEALADAAFELYERLMFGITVKSGGNVSFKLASDLSANMAATMMSPVYAQVNPEIVGSEKRDLEVAIEYGNRLARTSGNASPFSVHRLVHNYPSHDFIIDADEARSLFSSVTYPQECLYELLAYLGDDAYNEASPGTVYGLTPMSLPGDAPDAEEHGSEDGSCPQAQVESSGSVDSEGDSEPFRGAIPDGGHAAEAADTETPVAPSEGSSADKGNA